MKYLESNQKSDSCDLVILIHGLEGSKNDWATPGGFTSGGNLTALLDESGISWMAADLYGYGDWHAVESDFDPSDISDEQWDSFISRSVETVYEMVQSRLDGKRKCSLQLVSYSAGCIILTALLVAYPDLPVTAVHMAAPVPQESMDDEYSLHNNIDLFKKKKIFWHCGKDDDENEEGEIERVFAKLPSGGKNMHQYDAGHSLPVVWATAAFKDITASLVDTVTK